MRTAIPRAGALRGGVPLHRKQSGAYYAQVVEAQDEKDEEEHDLEANEAYDDELEAEYQEAVAMMTIAKQRRAEVDKRENPLQLARPSSTSSSRNFRVCDLGNSATGKTIMIARRK